MFCSSCGTQLNPNSRFCNVCGAPIADTAVAAPAVNLDNLYKLARMAKDENNVEKSIQYYEQILLADSNSWEAAFYSAYYSAILKCRNSEMGLANALLQNRLEKVIGLIKDHIKDKNEQIKYTQEIVRKLNDICGVFYNINKEGFDDFYQRYSDAGYSEHNKNLLTQCLKQTSYNNLGISKIYYQLGKNLLKMLDIDIYFETFIEPAIKNAMDIAIRNPCYPYLNSYGSEDLHFYEIRSLKNEVYKETEALEKSCDNILNRVKQMQEVLAKQRFKKYWDSHKSEKAALESEKQSLAEQIANINKEIPQIPGYSEMTNLSEQVEKLVSEKKALGFFKFKEKKTMQKQIDSANNDIEVLRSRINPAIEEIKNRISQIESKIKAIDTELTKPR